MSRIDRGALIDQCTGTGVLDCRVHKPVCLYADRQQGFQREANDQSVAGSVIIEPRIRQGTFGLPRQDGLLRC